MRLRKPNRRHESSKTYPFCGDCMFAVHDVTSCPLSLNAANVTPTMNRSATSIAKRIDQVTANFLLTTLHSLSTCN